MSANVLRIRDLAVRFRVAEGTVRAVDGVSFAVPQGRTVALVGESGSGKTVVSQSILRILPRAAEIDRGEILFFDPERPGTFVDIARLPPESRDMRMLRAGRIGIVFQEPMTTLSPLHTNGDQVSESLTLHRRLSRAEADEITVDMLRMVGFPEPAQALHRYPFELSGGLRQRAVLAIATGNTVRRGVRSATVQPRPASAGGGALRPAPTRRHGYPAQATRGPHRCDGGGLRRIRRLSRRAYAVAQSRRGW